MRRLVFLLVAVFVASLVFAMPAVTATKSSSSPRMRTMTKSGKKYRCYRVTPKKKSVHRARSTPARKGAGPSVVRPTLSCPAPIVNVPQQPAPVVNVPEQPAPVVNVAPPPPTAAITVDATCIYIVQDNQLMILGKSDLCLKSKVNLDQMSSTATSSGSSP